MRRWRARSLARKAALSSSVELLSLEGLDLGVCAALFVLGGREDCKF